MAPREVAGFWNALLGCVSPEERRLLNDTEEENVNSYTQVPTFHTTWEGSEVKQGLDPTVEVA